MSTLWSITFWADAGERALKTAAQAILMGFSLSNSTFINAFELDLVLAGQMALSGFVLSLLFSIVSAPIGGNGTASMLPSPPGPEAPPEDPEPFPPPPGG